MSADYSCEDVPQFAEPFPAGMEEANRDDRFATEPCRMAEAANFDIDGEFENENKMATDVDQSRVLQYIADMCLDRPCPNCQGEVIDRPQDDLRQCRACGELWGFDDTQTIDEFVREFGRMEPCQGCGTDRLDDFQMAAADHGRQELICLRCKTVQETGPPAMDRDEEFEFLEMKDRHDQRNRDELNEMAEDNEEEKVALKCPLCPDMTYDFFEKTFDRNVLVRAVCPACSHVVLDKGKLAEEATGDERRPGAREKEPRFRGRRAPTVRDAVRKFSVRMFNLNQQTPVGQRPEEDHEDTMRADQLFPRMGEEVGLTIGTAMGSIILKNRDQADATGTVGAFVGKAVCNALYRSASKVLAG